MNRLNKISIIYIISYAAISILIWIYGRWITNGSLGTFERYMTNVYGIVLSLLSLRIGVEVICGIDNGILIRKWKLTTKKLGFLMLLSAYFGFALSGYYSAITTPVSFKGIIKIIVVSVWCFPQLLSIIYLIQWAKEKVDYYRCEEKQIDTFIGWKLFIIAFIVWNLIYVGFWPGGIPVDGNHEIETAIGNYPLSTWQPYVHVYLVKFALALGKHIAMFFMMQIAFEAFLLSSFLSYFHRKYRIPRVWIYCIHLLMVLHMPLFSLGMVLTRDPIFSLGFAWLVFLLVIYNDEKTNSVRFFYFQLFFASFIVTTMRSNGIITLIILSPLLIYTGLKDNNRKLIFLSVSIAVLWILINGPMVKILNVEKFTKDNHMAETIIDDMKAVRYYGGELPEGAEEYLESVKRDGVNHWYDNFDYFLWKGKTYDMSKVSTAKLLSYYIRTFCTNPYNVLRNRLTKSSVIWAIDGSGEIVVRDSLYLLSNNDRLLYERKEGAMTPFSKALKSFTYSLYADAITFRPGFSIVLILLLCLYSKKRKKFILATSVILFNFASLVVYLLFHEIRYVYWIVLCTIVMVIYEIFSSETNYSISG